MAYSKWLVFSFVLIINVYLGILLFKGNIYDTILLFSFDIIIKK